MKGRVSFSSSSSPFSKFSFTLLLLLLVFFLLLSLSTFSLTFLSLKEELILRGCSAKLSLGSGVVVVVVGSEKQT